jgi:hypothetical protein
MAVCRSEPDPASDPASLRLGSARTVWANVLFRTLGVMVMFCIRAEVSCQTCDLRYRSNRNAVVASSGSLQRWTCTSHHLHHPPVGHGAFELGVHRVPLESHQAPVLAALTEAISSLCDVEFGVVRGQPSASGSRLGGRSRMVLGVDNREEQFVVHARLRTPSRNSPPAGDRPCDACDDDNRSHDNVSDQRRTSRIMPTRFA